MASDRTRPVSPQRAVASFDSASAMLRATARALQGRDFAHLGQSVWQALPVRASGALPLEQRQRAYSLSAALGAVPVSRLPGVDMEAVADWTVGHYPDRGYPAVFLGASNGAVVHLAAALGVPWLPQTVLLPVRWSGGDPQRPAESMRFGARVAPPFLDRNPDVVLHSFHDANQDRLMLRQMAYFRVKRRRLGRAHERFLTDQLAHGAPIVLVEDRTTWPVTRVGDRHVFQHGAYGGMSPREYAASPGATEPDDEAPEAEWGTDPALCEQVRDWAARRRRWAGRAPARRVVRGDGSVADPAHGLGAVLDTVPRWQCDRCPGCLPGRRPAVRRNRHHAVLPRGAVQGGWPTSTSGGTWPGRRDAAAVCWRSTRVAFPPTSRRSPAMGRRCVAGRTRRGRCRGSTSPTSVSTCGATTTTVSVGSPRHEHVGRMAAPRMPAEFVTRYWDLPYGRMRSRSLGQRRPGVPDVVLVMGMAVADYLMPALATLGEWTRGHLVEFPGYAGSGEPPEPLDVPGFGAAVTAWLEAADLGPVELAGHSSGTQVAARAAAQAGRQLIERLVLASPTVDPVARSAPRLLLHWRLDGRREPPGLTESHKPEWARAGVRGIRHLVRVHLAEQAPAGRFEQMPGAHTFPWLDPAAWSTPIRCLVDAPPA